MTGQIRKLDEAVINRIAAGEVIHGIENDVFRSPSNVWLSLCVRWCNGL